MKLVIINYRQEIFKALCFAIERLGYKAVLSNDQPIKAADKWFFVGETSSAMKMLLASSLDTLIPTLTQPVLGICLGMQLMCNKTERETQKD
jgi:glutamine amidotransferase